MVCCGKSFGPHWHYGRLICGHGCPPNKERVFPHKRERIYLGPKTGEIVIDVHRNPHAGLYDNLDVVLKIRRHRCAPVDDCGRPLSMPETELKPYASDKTAYHFPIEGEFFTDIEKFPKGFYIGDLVIDGCVVDSFELVKAPGVWVGEAIATTGMCFETKIFKDQLCPVEDCEEKKKPKGRRPCESKVYVAGVIDNPMYISDLSELFEE